MRKMLIVIALASIGGGLCASCGSSPPKQEQTAQASPVSYRTQFDVPVMFHRYSVADLADVELCAVPEIATMPADKATAITIGSIKTSAVRGTGSLTAASTNPGTAAIRYKDQYHFNKSLGIILIADRHNGRSC